MLDIKIMGKSSDKRILFTKVFVGMALFFSLLTVLILDIKQEDQAPLILMISIFAMLNFFGFALLWQNKSASLILGALSLYFWIAYPGKLLLTLLNPQSAVFLLEFLRPEVIQNEIVDAFHTVFPGLIALLAGFLIGRNNIHANYSSTHYVLRHKFFIAIITCLMLLKIFIQTFLDIGLPGITPKELPIPFLVGFLALITRTTLFAIVNLYFYSVLRLGEHKKILIATSLLIINILLALRVGWKFELALQGFLIAYYILDPNVYKSMAKTQRRLISLLTLLCIISMITLYPLVNVYRNNLLAQQEFSEAIARTEVASKEKTASSLFSILDRIPGIREFYLAIKLGAGKNFPLNSLLNGTVPDLIKKRLYGRDKDKAITAFATTLLAVFYLIGGVPFLTLGCFIVGWSIRWTASYINNRIFLSSITFDAYLPFFIIAWVGILVTGGSILLLIKGFALVLGCLFVIERVCYSKEANVESEKFHSARVENETKSERGNYV